MSSEISLNDLKEQRSKKLEDSQISKPQTFEAVSTTDIRPAEDPFKAQRDARESVGEDIDKAINKRLETFENDAKKLKESMDEVADEKEINSVGNEEDELDKELSSIDITTISDNAPASNNISVKNNKNIIDDDSDLTDDDSDNTFESLNDKDLDELAKELDGVDESSNEEEENNKIMENYKTLVKEKIKPVLNIVDLKSLTITNKAVSVNKALSNITTTNSSASNISDWVLPHTGRVISMRSFCGDDIDRLGRDGSRNPFNNAQDIYNIIYDHVMDSDKPDSMEAWLKTIDFIDLTHIYFAIYKASFEKSNYVPYICPECKEVFMPEFDIKEMVKYKSEKDKKMVEEILLGNRMPEHTAELVQVSDNLAISIQIPTLYNITFENLVLDEFTREKFADILGIIAYIQDFYVIDIENGTMSPIEYKKFAADKVKTTKSKLLTYTKLFKTLTSDQRGIIDSAINAITETEASITYILPQSTCPKCNAVIKEEEKDATKLLFTRHRLTAIAT